MGFLFGEQTFHQIRGGSIHMNKKKLILYMVPAAITVFLTAGACAAAALNLPQTGQTKCYSHSSSYPWWTEAPCAETGQDGDTQAGLAWPSPRFSQNADTTITDNLTGLVWVPDGNIMVSRDEGWDTHGTTNDGAVSWHHALNYVKKLNAENYLGHDDWRLPNVNELESLVNADVPDPAVWLNNSGFVNVHSGAYWSSTTADRARYAAWFVGINSGRVLSSDKGDEYLLVWPVRAGQGDNPASIWKTGQVECYTSQGYDTPCAGTGQDGDTQAGVAWPSPRFSDNGNDTVTDNLTGLMWTKSADSPGPSVCLPANLSNWHVALDYVACLNSNNYLGHNDWRLPNRKEIRSLIDYSRNTSALPLLRPFTGVRSGFWDFYWSSTTNSRQISEAWIIYLTNGAMTSGSKTSGSSYWVWPVRAGEPPDLISEDGVPLTACRGQTIAVIDTTKNTGGGTTGPSTTKFFFSTNAAYDAEDIYLGSREVPSLNEESSDSGNTDVILPATIGVGTYYIITRVDANEVVFEGNETNNDNSLIIHIGPDLVISDLSVSTCVKPGLSGYVKVTIENRGGCPAGRSIIKFYASRNAILDTSDIYLGYSAPMPSLAAGASDIRKISATVPPEIPAGSYFIIAEADAYNSVREFNESNNVKAKYVKIRRCP
jgi:hypothetical protein